MKVVLVVWRDAWTNSEEMEDSELALSHRPYMQHSVGFLIKRDKTGITLAGDYGEDGEKDRHLFIDAGMVKSVVTIRK